MELFTSGEAETEALGEQLAANLKGGEVLALYGDMGAGKTAFVRGLGRGLGVGERVTSPTYTIVNEYFGRLPLYHFDMYRLGGSEELYNIGWEDYLAKGGVCAVEWAQRVDDALDGSIAIEIKRIDENNRVITIDGGDIQCFCSL